MPSIATTDARGLFTKKLIDVYTDRVKPTGFLRSFFPTVESPTLEVSIEVQRGTESVAVDVFRGTTGDRSTWDRSTEKLTIPPYFRRGFDATKLQLYNNLFQAKTIDDAIFTAFINRVVDKQMELRDTIERAMEIQCKNVLETGIILNAGTNTSIDYKRKALSKVDPGGGNYWTDAINPFDQIEVGCKFLRTVGKATGAVFNLVIGQLAQNALYKNAAFLSRQNLFNMKLDNILAPQRNAEGAAFLGQMTCGSYLVNLWTYPQTFDIINPVSGAVTSAPYVDDKLAILIPETPRFKMAFGAVPQLIEEGTMPVMGAFIYTDYKDVDKRAHFYDVESCPLAVPVGVDQIWTFKAVA